MQFAQRMQWLPAHYFASLGVKLSSMDADGKDVIRLDEGAPDMPPEPWIVDALATSAANPTHHSYQPHRGNSQLRQAWSSMYQRAYGVEIDPEREVLPLLGSKEGIFHLAMAVVDVGDIVLVPDPGYITYTRGALFAGGQPEYFSLMAERGYLPDLGGIPGDIARRAKILWLNYPNNPTAAVASLEFFAQAVDFAREHNLIICHDAAYTQVTFDGYRAPSLLEAPGAKDVGVEFNTLSKSHNMAGWRVGAALGSADVLRTLYTLKTNVDSSHFLPVMDAATEAMQGDQTWLARRNETYRQRRDVLLAGLKRLGLVADTPQGSLYVWCRTPPGWSSIEFVNEALEKAHVSLTPGSFFGQNGEGHLRIALTVPVGRIEEAVDRLERWLAK